MHHAFENKNVICVARSTEKAVKFNNVRTETELEKSFCHNNFQNVMRTKS